MNTKLRLLSLAIMSSMSISAYALQAEKHTVVAPACLLKNMSGNYQALATSAGLNLIETNEKGIDQLIAAKEATRKAGCGGFMDVTTAWDAYDAKSVAPVNKAASFLMQYTQPKKLSSQDQSTVYTIKYQTQVNQLLNQMNPQDIWDNLTILSAFPDRYSRGDNGVKAAAWIKSRVEEMAKKAGRTDVTAYYVSTGDRYKQPSVVVKVGHSTEAGVVVGGHMDTLQSSAFGNMPGADDDGSGSMSVMEAARLILSSGMQFKKPIYFVWYSAEELGLIGSQYVVADFKAKKIPVDAVLQLDMTGYEYKNESTIWLMDDYVNKDLTSFTETLVNTYVNVPVKHSRCGYACSDHASWTQGGFKSSMPFETEMNRDNPNIHSSNDTMDHLTLQHMADFAKLGTAFAVELAEPVTK